jgi:hypothetical protein
MLNEQNSVAAVVMASGVLHYNSWQCNAMAMVGSATTRSAAAPMADNVATRGTTVAMADNTL